MSSVETYLASLSDRQFTRLVVRIWGRLTRDDGYQPYGYDWRTLRTTKPGWAKLWYAVCLENGRRSQPRGGYKQVDITITSCRQVPRWDTIQTVLREATREDRGMLTRIHRVDNGVDYGALGEYRLTFRTAADDVLVNLTIK